LQRLERSNEEGFLIRLAGDNAICGVVNLNVITWEALCSAYMSYYAVQKYAGRGYMKEGMRLVIDHAFNKLGLHRLEANIQPGNERSIRFVESLGFECEGYSPRYLKINGKWRDHERWALLADG
jgi:ribosomal-protein-alanine N-acetyltransferase